LAAQGKYRDAKGHIQKVFVRKPKVDKPKKEMPYLNKLCHTKNKFELVQKVAVDFLTEIEMYWMQRPKVMEERHSTEFIDNLYKTMKAKYQVCDDPFTSMCCTTAEYCDNKRKYEEQVMEERYGHHGDV